MQLYVNQAITTRERINCKATLVESLFVHEEETIYDILILCSEGGLHIIVQAGYHKSLTCAIIASTTWMNLFRQVKERRGATAELSHPSGPCLVFMIKHCYVIIYASSAAKFLSIFLLRKKILFLRDK